MSMDSHIKAGEHGEMVVKTHGGVRLALKDWAPIKYNPIASTGLSPIPHRSMDIFPS
jgi:hypothetical protein